MYIITVVICNCMHTLYLCVLLFNQLNVVPKVIEFLSMTLQVRRTEVPILLGRYINVCSSVVLVQVFILVLV